MDATLNELLPRRLRLWLYVVIGLVALGLTIWQAAEGNWFVFTITLATTLESLLAAKHVTPPLEVAIDEVPTSILTAELGVRNVTLQDLLMQGVIINGAPTGLQKLVDQGLHHDYGPASIPNSATRPDDEHVD